MVPRPPEKFAKIRKNYVCFHKSRVFGAKNVFCGLKTCFGAQKRDLWPYGTLAKIRKKHVFFRKNHEKSRFRPKNHVLGATNQVFRSKNNVFGARIKTCISAYIFFNVNMF